MFSEPEENVQEGCTGLSTIEISARRGIKGEAIERERRPRSPGIGAIKPPKRQVTAATGKPVPKKAARKKRAAWKKKAVKEHRTEGVPVEVGDHRSAELVDPAVELQVATGLVAAFGRSQAALSMKEILHKMPLRRPADSVVVAVIYQFADRRLLDFARDGRVACLKTRKLRDRIVQLQVADSQKHRSET